MLLAAAGLAAGDALAQTFTFPPRPPASSAKPATSPLVDGKPAPNAQMLVHAGEINYDYSNHLVSAVGNVQIYYAGSTLEADKVVYDQNTKRLRAEGNARLTEPDGRVTYGQVMELRDDFRDGFVDSLRLDAPDQTRFAAASAQRSGGNFTVFQSGVYTACEPCKEDPRKPPLWQVKAARIIHDEGEKMIYFEDARLEFVGVPLAYFPYFSAPDPTVKRKTGFLMPSFSSSTKYGLATSIPYFWVLAPDYDVTFTPTITSRQGPLLQGEFRQRLESGSYWIRASGLYQLDKSAFGNSSSPAYRDWRGSVEASGQFALNQAWTWGFDGVLPSDKFYYQDYPVGRFTQGSDPLRSTPTEGISQVYIAGRGNRSYFDARSLYFYGFSSADVQGHLPVVHPVMDYNYTFGQPVLGGEAGFNINLTSLSRQQASFDPITQNALTTNLCGNITADTAIKVNNSNCLLRGTPGTYSRFTTEAHWKRTITDRFGQQFTPFVSLRADLASVSIDNELGVSNYITTGNDTVVRAMPTVGVEYRYPFINVQPWGTQTITPIAQVIIRPNEPNVGTLPNEDAQSLVFDDSNLFRVDKFSGYDRLEGGGRANVGLQYNVQFNRAGFVNVLVGQSYHLFGTNSFAVGDATNTGLDSGLDKTRSDYVARVSYQPNSTYMFTTRYRVDSDSFALKRFEAEARANFDRWTVSMLYGNYDAQPELGFLYRREGIYALSTVKVTPNWAVIGGARYDIHLGKFDQTRIGVGYVDDCLILALNYITSYTYSGNPQADHRVMLELSLRTLGGGAVNQTVGQASGSF